MVEFKSKYFSAEQIKKIDEGMKLLLEKGKELDELKIVVKKLKKELETQEEQIIFYKENLKHSQKEFDKLKDKFNEQVKMNDILQEQIETFKDKEEYQEIDEEEFNSFYDYFFTKQEKV